MQLRTCIACDAVCSGPGLSEQIVCASASSSRRPEAGKRGRRTSGEKEDDDPLAALAEFGKGDKLYVSRRERKGRAGAGSASVSRDVHMAPVPPVPYHLSRMSSSEDRDPDPKRALVATELATAISRSAPAAAAASSSSASSSGTAVSASNASAAPDSSALAVLGLTPGAGGGQASLMDVRRAFEAAMGGSVSAKEKRRQLEADLLRQVLAMQQKALKSAQEHASGVSYDKPLLTDWKPPSALAALPKAVLTKLRDNYKVIVTGPGAPPPCGRFEDMRLPPAILRMLKAKGIIKPTPIQVQGLPVALSGRDMVGVAFTGSGKTLVFTLPLVLQALQEELRKPLMANEGPFGLLLAPSRELATQTHALCEQLSEALVADGFPALRSMLCIGGMDGRAQLEPLRRSGVHIVVATPGRLKDHLDKGRMNLALCKYVCLDEGDRMLDASRGFEEELKAIFSHFDHQRQTLIFSATMPRKVQEFAMGALVMPVTVNSGRAGAASMDVIQEVEYVKEEAKMLYLLECLQKTAPPVMIFNRRSGEVDDITQYLLLKGVDAVSIHGGKEQADRHEALRQFRAGEKDVLVASDVAAKGLDFPGVQHVINFDMPESIENYVHRVGRTGRGGKTGVATTFINKTVAESVLLDLKHLLKAAKQRIPPVLMALDDPHDAMETDEDGNLVECLYCQGFGHSILACDKLQRDVKTFDSKFRDGLKDDDGFG